MIDSWLTSMQATGPLSGATASPKDFEMWVEFSNEPPDEFMPVCRFKQASIISDTRIKSSLALVLLLHSVLACLLWYSPKPQIQGQKWIDVQLVSLQGYPEAGGQKDFEAGAAGPPAAPAAPEKQDLHAGHPAPESISKPPAVPKNKPVPVSRPKKVERAAVNPGGPKEIKYYQPSNPVRTGDGANQSEGSSQGPGAVASTNAGTSDHGGAAGKGAPGGSGILEKSFGSPDGPSFLNKVLPVYPALAKKLEKQGTVLLRVTIDERGRPVKVEVLTKAGFGFDEEAVKAVQGSTFVPAKKEGKALACKALLPIRFVLRSS